MSKTVENRVLEMQFNNKQFESNVQQSMSTLDKLKQKLKFDKGADGLDKVGKAAKNVKLDPLAQSVDKVKASFSALDVVAVTALSNITNSAVNAGKKMVKALTLDPIMSGFQEYETKINAVQTILANTSKEGMTMQDVTTVLDDLNYYADKTIYNFTEMTRNIGTFTAAGVKLYDAAGAIKGIANLAAVSGSNSYQASTAMYQLSQALAAGAVKLQDWNSVVNAGMGGTKFQEALKQTARDMGIAVDEMIESTGSFRESLRSGWLSADVLNQTLKNFTVEGAREYAQSMLAMGAYTQEQADALMREAQIAEDAATKVKTFTQLWDVMKEAAQSGWAQTWEIIIGDFEEAKEFLTPIADLMQAVIGESANARNSILEGGLQSNWKTLSADVRACGIDVNDFQNKLIEVGKAHGVITDEMIVEAGSFAQSLKEGWVTPEIFAEAMRSYKITAEEFGISTEDMQAHLEEFQATVREVWESDLVTQQEKLRALSAAGYDYNDCQELISATLEGQALTLDDLTVAQMKALGYTQDEIMALQDMATEAETTGSTLNNLINTLTEPSGRELVLEGFSNILMNLVNIMDVAKQAWREVFPPLEGTVIYGWMEAFRDFTERISLTAEGAENLRETLRGLFSILHILSQIIGVPLKVGLEFLFDILSNVRLPILDVTAVIGNMIYAFDQAVFASGRFEKAVRVLPDTLRVVASYLRMWFEEFKQLPQVQAFTNAVKMKLNRVLDILITKLRIASDEMREFIDRIREMDMIHLTDIPGIFVDFKDNVLGSVIDFGAIGEKMKSIFSKTIDQVKEFGSNIGEVFSNIGSVLKNVGQKFRDIIKDDFDLSDIVSLLASGAGVAAIMTFKSLIELLQGPMEALENISKGIEKNMKAKAFKTVADGIRSLATALLELAIALAIISKIDWDDLGKAGLVLVALGGALVGMAAAMKKIGAGAEGQNILNGGAILAFGASIFLLAKALSEVAKIDTAKLLPDVLALGSIIAGLVAAMRLLTVAEGVQIAASSGLMFAFSMSIRILVSSLKQLDDIDVRSLPKTITLLLASILTLSKLAKIGSTVNWKSGISMVAMVASVKMLVMLIDDLSAIDPESALKSALAIIPVLLALRTIMSSVSGMSAGANIVRAGVTIALISGSILLIANAMKAMAKLGNINCAAGGAAITAFLATFALILKASADMSKYIMRAGVSFLMMAGAISSLALVMTLLSKLDPAGLGRATAAILALQGAFIGLVAVSRYAIGEKGTIVALAGAVTAMSAAIVALGMLDPAALARATICVDSVVGTFAALVYASQFAQGAKAAVFTMMGVAAGLSALLLLLTELPIESTLEASKSLSLLMVTLAGSLAVISIPHLAPKEGTIAIYAMLGVVTALAVLLGAMDELDVQASIETAKSITILLGTMSVVTAAAAAIGAFGGPSVLKNAAMGAAAIDAVIGIVGAFMVGIGALATYIPEVEQFAKKGIEVLNIVASGIGQFVGNVIGGIAEGATAHLGPIADNLSDFITRLEPFLKKAEKIDPSISTSIGALATALLKLTAADFLNGILSFLSGGNAIEEFAEQLLPLGEALGQFADKTKGINSTQLTGVADSCLKLAEMAASLPSSGGLKEAIAGAKDITNFIDNLDPLAEAIVRFNSKISGANIDIEKLNQVTQAISQIVQMAAALPSSGGILQDLTGVKDLSIFADQLVDFGKALSKFSKKTDKIDVEKIMSVSEAAQSLVDLANELPKMQGVFQAFSGSQDFGIFGDQLAKFGQGLAKYSKSISGNVDEGAIKASSNAAAALVELANNLPDPGFFGTQLNLEQFANQLVPFGQAFAEFAESIEGIENMDAVSSCAKVAQSMSELANNLPSDSMFDGKLDLQKFGQQLRTFGSDFMEFYYYVEGLDTGNLDGIILAMDSIGLMAESLAVIPAENFSKLTTMVSEIVKMDFDDAGSKLRKFALDVKYFTNQIGNTKLDAVDTLSTALQKVVDLHKSIKDAKLSEDTGLRTFGSEVKSFGKSLSKFSKAVTDVDPGKVENAMVSLERVAGVAEKLQDVDMSGFASFVTSAQGMKKVGKALMGFQNETADLDQARTAELVDIVADLGETAKTLGTVDTEGLRTAIRSLKDIAGEDFSGLKTNMDVFGEGMKVLNESFSGLDPNLLGNTTIAVQGLKALVEGMPPREDIQKKLSIGNLGAQVEKFGPHLANFAKSIEGVKPEAVASCANASKALAELANMMPEIDHGFGAVNKISLSTFATDVKAFGPALANFSACMFNVKPAKVTECAQAAESLAALAKNLPEMKTGFEVFFGGGQMTLSQLGAELMNFGPALANFSTYMFNVKPDKITSAATASQALADLAGNMPQVENGFSRFFGGGKMTLSQLGAELISFGPALLKFSNFAYQVKPDQVTGAAQAGEALARLAGQMPEIGSGFSRFFGMGKMTLSQLGAELNSFGPALATFSQNVGGDKVDAAGITSAADAAGAMVTLLKSLPDMDNVLGAASKGYSRMTLSQFGEQMSGFGPALAEFAESISGVKNYGDIRSVADSAKGLVDLVKMMPDVNNVIGGIATGVKKMSLSELGTQIIPFGEALASFAGSIAGVENLDQISEAATAAEDLVSVVQTLGASGGVSGWVDMKTAAAGIEAIGEAMESVGEDIVNVDTSKINALSPAISTLVQVAKDAAANEAGEGFKTFAEGLAELADIELNSVVEQLSGGAEKITAALEEIKAAFDSGWSSAISSDTTSSMTTSITNVLTQTIGTINEKRESFSSAGEKLGTALSDGIKDKATDAQTKVTTALETMVTTIRGKRASFQSAGSYAIAGVAAGMESQRRTLVAKAQSIANSINSAFNSTLDINSPSRVMMKTGKSVVEGVSLGMTKNAGLVTSAATRSANNLIDAYKDTLKIHSPSIVGRDEVGKFVIEGIAEGIAEETAAEQSMREKAEELERQAVQLAENIATAFQKKIDEVNISKSMQSAKYELWQLMNPKANEKESAMKYLELMGDELAKLKWKIELAAGEMDMMAEKFGENSEHYQEAWSKWMDAQKEYYELKKEMSEQSATIRDYGYNKGLEELDLLKEQLALEYELKNLYVDEEDTATSRTLQLEQSNRELEIMVKRMGEMKKQLAFYEEGSEKYIELQNNMFRLQIEMARAANTIRDTMKSANKEVEEYNKGLEDKKQAYVDEWMNMLDKVEVLQKFGYSLEQIDEIVRKKTDWKDQVPKAMEYTVQKTADIVNQAMVKQTITYSDFIKNSLNGAFIGLPMIGEAFTMDLSNGISGGSKVISSTSYDTAKEAVTAIQPIKNDFNNNGTQIGNALAVGIAKSTPKVESSTDKLNNIFKQLGNNIQVTMNGIVSGINSSLNQIANQITNTTNKVVSGSSSISSGLKTIYNDFDTYGATLNKGIGASGKPTIPGTSVTYLSTGNTAGHNQAILNSIKNSTAKNTVANNLAAAGAGATLATSSGGKLVAVTNNYSMTQNNTSPKAISSADTYRNTKSLFAAASGGASSSKISNTASKTATRVGSGVIIS